MFRTATRSRSRGALVLGIASLAAVTAVGVNVTSTEPIASALVANNELDCSQYTTGNGNIVLDEGSCLDLDYVPDVAGADAESQRIALGLFMGTMEACIAFHTEADVESGGYGQSDGETLAWQHYGSDNPQTLDDIDAMIEQSANPPDVVVFTEIGEMVQTMFSGKEITNLGSIPQLHDHRGEKWEMLHINCRPTIEEAFSYGGFEPEPTDTSVYQAALDAARSGGIAAVSSQLGQRDGGTTTPRSTLGATTGVVGGDRAGTIAGTTTDRTTTPREATTRATISTPSSAVAKRGRIIEGMSPARSSASDATPAGRVVTGSR